MDCIRDALTAENRVRSSFESSDMVVRRGSEEVAGSPFDVDMLPGATSALESLVSGLNLSAVAGVPANISVQVTLDEHTLAPAESCALNSVSAEGRLFRPSKLSQTRPSL